MDVKIEDRGLARWVTIDRPQARNAFNSEVLERIGVAITEAEHVPAVRAVVLTGSGDRAFCAGADLQEAQADREAVFDSREQDHPLVALFGVAEGSPKPIIGRVNGAAMGGGLGLVCMCDLVVASDAAKFGTPEARIGVFPMVVMSHLLRIVPRRVLSEMVLTGEPLGAEAAREAGLVNHVVPFGELDATVEMLLQRISACSPQALATGKRALQAMQDMSLPQCLAYSQQMIARLARSDDAAEGMAAFIGRRKPAWQPA